MTYVVIKMIKGNPYKYLVRSVREGDKVRQVFIRYLGRAGEGEGADYEPEPVEREVRERPVATAPIKETITAVEVEKEMLEPKPTPTPVTKEPWETAKDEFEKKTKALGIKIEYSDAEIPHLSADHKTIMLPKKGFDPRQATHELLHTVVNDDSRVGYINEGFRQELNNPKFKDEAERASREMFDGISLERILKSQPPHEIMTELWASGAYNKYPEMRRFLNEGLTIGKPVPPEVLKDYPELAAKPAEPVETKPAEPIREGDKVKDTQGREWTVLDASDPSKLRVESPQGVSTSIGRKTVEKVEAVIPEVTPVTPEVTKGKLDMLTGTEADYLNSTIHGMYHDYKAGEPITASIETYLDKMPGRVLSPERKAEIAIERKVEKLRDKIEELDERIETAESAGRDTKVLEKQRQLLEDETQRLESEVIPKPTIPKVEATPEEARPYPMSPQERRRAILESRIKRGEPVPDKLLAEFPDLKAEVSSVKPELEPTPKETTKEKESLIARHTETRMSPETGLDTEYSTEYRVIEAPENAGAEWMGNPYGVIRIFSKGGVEVDRDLLEVGMSPEAVIKALPYETSYKKAEKFGLAKTEYEKYEKGLADKEQAKEAKEQAEQAGYENYNQAIRDLGSIKGVKKTNISYFSPVDNTQKTNEGFDVGQGVGVVIHKVGNSNEYAVTHINTGLAMGHNWKNRAEAIALAKSVAGITDWSQFSNEKEIPQEIMSKAASLVRGFTQKNLQAIPIEVKPETEPATPEVAKISSQKEVIIQKAISDLADKGFTAQVTSAGIDKTLEETVRGKYIGENKSIVFRSEGAITPFLAEHELLHSVVAEARTSIGDDFLTRYAEVAGFTGEDLAKAISAEYTVRTPVVEDLVRNMQVYLKHPEELPMPITSFFDNFKAEVRL